MAWKSFILNEQNQWMSVDDKLLHSEEITYEQALTYVDYTKAAHAFLYSKDPDVILFSGDKKHAAILMQCRFDGLFGFPGGLIDKRPNEPPVEGLNRELEEEIFFDIEKHAFTQENFVMSHVNHKGKLVTFFYAKEFTLADLHDIEKRVMLAKEWGQETMGTLRVPLYHMKDKKFKGLPIFLTNRFAGNAKLQLLETITKFNIIPAAEFESTIKAYMEYSTPK